MKLLHSTLALCAAVYTVDARYTLIPNPTFGPPAIQRTANIGQRIMEVPTGPVLSERRYFKAEAMSPYPSFKNKRQLPESVRPRVPIPLGVSPTPIGYLGPPLPKPQPNPFSSFTTSTGVSAFTAEGLSSSLIPPTFDGTIVIFARGTGQYGNIGQNPGPQFMSALQKVLGTDRVIFQGLKYPGSAGEFFRGGSPSGTRDMATMAEDVATKFPRAKIVLSGYSQGAQVVHNAVGALATKKSLAVDQIKAIVVFGDPYNKVPLPPALSSRIRTYCNANDEVCFGGWRQSIGHLTYDKFAMDAAAWVQRQTSA